MQLLSCETVQIPILGFSAFLIGIMWLGGIILDVSGVKVIDTISLFLGIKYINSLIQLYVCDDSYYGDKL